MNMLTKLVLVKLLDYRFYRWDRAALARHQSRRLRSVLEYARRRSPYYSRMLAGPADGLLDRSPYMDKAQMMRHFNEINTAGLHRDELVEFKMGQESSGDLGLFLGTYSVGLSSGTSDNRGLAVLSKTEMERYSCLLWARSGLPENLRKRHILFALRTNNPAFMSVTSFGVKIVYVDYTHAVADIINIVNREGLNILAGPPSLLMMIARQKHRIENHIDALISYAEILTDDCRAGLERAFGVRVAQIYQGSEGFIASTCRSGRLHLNEDVVLVELEDIEGNKCNIKNVILTDLYRTTQPIIRYRLNDLIETSDTPCECGSCFTAVERIHGRADDIFLLKGKAGGQVCLFPDYVRRSIIFASDAIQEYQAIQHSPDYIEVRLVFGEDAGDIQAIKQAIVENLCRWAEKAGGGLGHVVFSQEPPERNPLSGKLIRVIRKF